MAIVEVPLSKTIKKAIVDDDDRCLLEHIWHVHEARTGRAKPTTVLNGRNQALGRVVMSRILGRPMAAFEQVGYWNNNPFDCRRRNLFVGYYSEINHRRCTFKNNETGFRGVTRMKRNGKYRARIYKDGVQIILGEFTHIEHAVNAYERAAANLYGEYSMPDYSE